MDRYCCNPLLKERHKTRGMLSGHARTVTADLAAAANRIDIRLQAGSCICSVCRKAISRMIKNPNCDELAKLRRRIQAADHQRQQPDVEGQHQPVESQPQRSSHIQAIERIEPQQQQLDDAMHVPDDEILDQDDDVQRVEDDVNMNVDNPETIEVSNEPGPSGLQQQHAGSQEKRVDIHTSGSSVQFVDRPDLVYALNEILPFLGIEIIDYQMIAKNKSYCKEMMDKITAALEKKIFKISPSNESPEDEMIRQLKDKFAATTDRDEKWRILSVLPFSWTAYKVRAEFGVSLNYAKSVKKLVEEKGILCVPNKRMATHTLSSDTVKRVKDFYLLSEISYTCPGKRDYISISDNGQKIAKQRRLLLMNLKEAFKAFKEENDDCQISFTKFTMLRPPECILALDGAGTRNACVCMQHQNVKLIFEPMKNMLRLERYDDLLKKMMCAVPTDGCYLLECPYCPGYRVMDRFLEEILEENDIWTVPHKQWVMTEGEIEFFC